MLAVSKVFLKCWKGEDSAYSRTCVSANESRVRDESSKRTNNSGIISKEERSIGLLAVIFPYQKHARATVSSSPDVGCGGPVDAGGCQVEKYSPDAGN